MLFLVNPSWSNCNSFERLDAFKTLFIFSGLHAFMFQGKGEQIEAHATIATTIANHLQSAMMRMTIGLLAKYFSCFVAQIFFLNVNVSIS